MVLKSVWESGFFWAPQLGLCSQSSIVFQHWRDLYRAAVKSMTCCSFLLIKAQLLTTAMAAAVLGNMFYISQSWQEGKPFCLCQRKTCRLVSWDWKLTFRLSNLSACNASCQNRWWMTRWQSTLVCFPWNCVVCKLVSFTCRSLCRCEMCLQGCGLRQRRAAVWAWFRLCFAWFHWQDCCQQRATSSSANVCTHYCMQGRATAIFSMCLQNMSCCTFYF